MARRAPARGVDPNDPVDPAIPPATDPADDLNDDLEDGDAVDAVASEHDAPITAMISDEVAQLLKIGDPRQRRLLAEACYVFGINPDPRLKPVELIAQRFDAGEPYGPSPTPASVTVVTAGGLKIRYPMDEDTEERLRIVYNAYTREKDGTVNPLPLPPDLTLPRANVDGIPHTREHQYRTGYLQSGGKAEADRRAATLDQLRRKGAIR